MSNKEYFNPDDKNRKPSVQEKLDKLKPYRKGKLSVFIDGIPGRSIPIMTTSCINCGEASPIISDGRFVCRKCVVIFPKFANRFYKRRINRAPRKSTAGTN